MSREIRITIDDDEVFERMKRRKGELDLSWEEVLHRGLRRERVEDPGRGGERAAHSPGHDADYDRDAGPRGHRGPRGPGPGPGDGGQRGRRGRRGAGDRGQGWDAFADSLEQQIRDRVYDSLQSSFGAAGIDVPDHPDLDDEMASLTSAEDATLVFPFLPDERASQVPLRVDMRTGPDGIDVEVVAVRQGKGVRDANRFDTGTRKQVNTRLARGEPARLEFADGAESYRVSPVLSWSRGDDGRPSVDEVEIAEVHLDGDE